MLSDLALRPIRVFSVCSGIAALDVAVDLATGGRTRTVLYVEREAVPAGHLVRSMEAGLIATAPIWSDLSTFDARPWRGVVDLLIGGIPCQPYSNAGKKRRGADERDLVDEACRVIGECRPAVVFIEEVAGFAVPDGLGRFGGKIQSLGYRMEAPVLVQAAEVGAPHKRERIFVLAWDVSDARRDLVRLITERVELGPTERWDAISRDLGQGLADTDRLWSGERGKLREWFAEAGVVREGNEPGREPDRCYPLGFPPAPDDGIAWREYLARGGPAPALTESELRRGSHGAAPRVDQLRMLGQSVVPLAVAYGFRTLAAGVREVIG